MIETSRTRPGRGGEESRARLDQDLVARQTKAVRDMATGSRTTFQIAQGARTNSAAIWRSSRWQYPVKYLVIASWPGNPYNDKSGISPGL
jgi:hypothetical protein